MLLFLNFIIVFVLVALSGLLSSVETSIAATDKDKILHSNFSISQRQQKRISKLMPQKEKIITSILIMFNVLNAIAAAIMASSLMDLFGKEKGRGWSVVIMSISSLLFAEIIPKIIAVSIPEYIVLRTTHLMNALLIICSPFNFVLDYITLLVHKLVNSKFRQKK
jgi:Mg2+/Co2+ transporter CorB